MKLPNKKILIVVVIVSIIGLYFLVSYKKIEFFTCKECSSSTGSDHVDLIILDKNDKLLPIMEPEFNFRECSKQLILLEDHLFNKGKRCRDCIKKHFLTAEGLCEEAISLDKTNKYTDITSTYPDQLRRLQMEFVRGTDPVSIAQSLRVLRKPLHTYFFDKIFDMKKSKLFGFGSQDEKECSACSAS